MKSSLLYSSSGMRYTKNFRKLDPSSSLNNLLIYRSCRQYVSIPNQSRAWPHPLHPSTAPPLLLPLQRYFKGPPLLLVVGGVWLSNSQLAIQIPQHMIQKEKRKILLREHNQILSHYQLPKWLMILPLMDLFLCLHHHHRGRGEEGWK